MTCTLKEPCVSQKVKKGKRAVLTLIGSFRCKCNDINICSIKSLRCRNSYGTVFMYIKMLTNHTVPTCRQRLTPTIIFVHDRKCII